MSQPIVPGSLRVPAQSIIDWATACLQALDMPPGDARLLAESLVQTSSWGIDSHGIARLPHYMERLSHGSIKARPDILVKETGPSTAQVHGDQGQADIIVGHRAACRLRLLWPKNPVSVRSASAIPLIAVPWRSTPAPLRATA